MPILASLICGFVFGCGLVISGMIKPTKVLGFLDVLGIASGTWDPSLIVVMVAGLAVAGIGYALIAHRRPLFAATSLWPTKRDIDRPLISGAILFGAGWGLVGLCPGPAIANLATLSGPVIVFVVTMAVGMLIYDLWQSHSAALAEHGLSGGATAAPSADG
jgi:uncharacterized membrane protein YedE/YeeE